jgi:sugar phosphate isomerase/epimerase
MQPSRREFLLRTGASLPALMTAATAQGQEPARTAMGIGISSYTIAARAERAFAEPVRFLEFCRQRGAGGVQVAIGARPAEYLKNLRALTDKYGMYLEGSLRPPRDRADLERFEAEVRAARQVGATVLRTVLLGGRRYETFKTAEEFRAFRARSLASLRLAEPVLARHRMTLAVENHKDFRADELVALLRQVGSEFVGACVDVGNNLALLEDVLTTVRALAPWARSCHFKDMAGEDHPEGFLLSEVPLGTGAVDLGRVVEVLRQARPQLRFSLEMITRDPLRIPCLTEGYWATLGEVPGRDLARTLAWARARKGRLPRVGALAPAAQLQAEDENVRQSLRFARAR